MSPIFLNGDDSDKLNGVTQPVELCDSTGRVLGHFVPLIDMSQWEPVTPPASEEELDRREQAGTKRYTTAEVLARLEKL